MHGETFARFDNVLDGRVAISQSNIGVIIITQGFQPVRRDVALTYVVQAQIHDLAAQKGFDSDFDVPVLCLGFFPAACQIACQSAPQAVTSDDSRPGSICAIICSIGQPSAHALE